MIRHFFKTTIRNLFRNKTYSFLNIFGLAIGIACAGLIFLWVEDETTYDNSYAKKDQLYAIRTNQTYDGLTRTFSSSPGPLAQAIKTEIPGIVNTCRVNNMNSLFTIGEKSVYKRGAYVDPSYLSMFTPELIAGDAKHALDQLNSVIISEKMATVFFGNPLSAAGKMIKLDNNQEMLVSAVMKNRPANTTMEHEWLAPYQNFYLKNDWLNNWGSNGTNTYAELAPGANLAAIQQKLHGFIARKAEGAIADPFLFAMSDWRLRDEFQDGKQKGGRIEYIRLFIVVAWIILLIACINFMNLATARSEKRAREVGVRKVLGAGKRSMIFQFIGEALFMAVVAAAAGLLLISIALPFFNIMIEKKISMNLTQPSHLSALLLIAVICGFVAGSYPALYLSSFNPVYVFKGIKIKSGSAAFIRKGLVVLQFSLSVLFIISTVIVYQQIQHVKNRDLGYDKDNLLSVEVHGDMVKNFTAIRQDLLNSGYIENAGLNSFNTISVGNNTSGLEWQGKEPGRDILISNRYVSPELIRTLNIQMQEGRTFESTGADSNNVIISASFAALMGPGSALGKIIRKPDNSESGYRQLTVVGITRDFLYGDMYGQKSDPVIFYADPSSARFLYIRSKKDADTKKMLAVTENILKKHNPAYPFDYRFVNEQFNAVFKSEMLVGQLSRIFAILAVIISCLGLFGLAAYTAERRTKEIGIRKILGASTAGITKLLSREFLQLVLISNIIAFPAAWWVMNKWLQSYHYRITISWWVFAAAGIAALLIAIATVSVQSVRAAMASPVKNLRTE
ncbi:ABC transporter permease [Sediminibacterium ginsengisoli]|uniref:Duplicated orphan permease n=1 Tax=Sediminibacterium ginsengisoli TaxID=413434 RepID=A0A1T4L1Y6_9BACT|nr:ABC transporter permease [Sediminibacterium ginsengisoli]SJZ48608.1 duplicated orphan permease [Sediminibacterium ginsengisoli]